MTREPHYVRFAQALALVTGLAGVTLGCSSPIVSGGADTGGGGSDSGSGGNDAAVIADSGGGGNDSGGGGDDSGAGADGGDTADTGGSSEDSGVIADAALFDCGTCDCGFGGIDSGVQSCEAAGHFECCVAVGPLAPPDLAV